MASPNPHLLQRRPVLGLLIALSLIPLAQLLPIHPDPLQPRLQPDQIRLGIGIFFAIGFLWITECIPLAVSALLVPVIGGLCRISDLKSSLAAFADPLIFLFLGGFALAAAMASQGIDTWLANRMVLLARGHFHRVALILFATTTVISLWMSNTATTALMIPLVMGILSQLRQDQPHPGNTLYLLLGTAYAASIGGLGTLVGTPPNGIAAERLGITFTGWLRFGIPTVLILLPLMVLTLLATCRPTAARFEVPEALRFELTRHRLLTLAIFAFTAISWTLGTWIAPLLGISQGFDTLVSLLALTALVTTGCLGWKRLESSTEWSVLLLFGGGIALSSLLDRTGTSLFLARQMVDHVGHLPLPLIIFTTLAFVILLGEFSSNTATAALMVPIFASVAAEMNLDAAKLVLPLALASSCGFMLPVATPPNAIVFATGKIPQRQMIRSGACLDAVCLLAITFLAWFWF